jgi:hypothetical protein
MITEDLDIFLSDFGVSITAGAVSGLGILDMPGEVVFDGVRESYTGAISSQYMLTCRTDEFGWLGYGDQVNVDDVGYRVQEKLDITDGRFCRLLMEKVAGDDPVEFVFDGDFE